MPFTWFHVTDTITIPVFEAVEGDAEPIRTAYKGTLKLNPGPLPAMPGPNFIIDVRVDNAGPGGQAQIYFDLDEALGSAQYPSIPANWSTVRSIEGHWIAPTELFIAVI